MKHCIIKDHPVIHKGLQRVDVNIRQVGNEAHQYETFHFYSAKI